MSKEGPTTEWEWWWYWRKFKRERRKLEKIAYDCNGPYERIAMENRILGIRKWW